ncbi:aspartate/glutamate racemase family protein [Nonomuraea sp. NPDC050153]|uniref:aspartate/glutamate racemase family protein n=1 Tax=Nonomuraea sp. NPDC050153 TaxID=3364359 RepID=UPI0037AAC4D5
MRTIGLIHGMSPASTVDFYQRLNDKVTQQLGGHESAELLMASVNFAVIERCVRTRAWDEMADYLAGKGRALERAGADFLVIGSNTGHQGASAVEAATSIPFIHIADVVADAAREVEATTLGLLGTTPVMEGDFYRDRLARRGLKVIIPPPADRELVNRIVFDELTKGVFADSTRAELVRVLRDLRAAGADAVILGCTEFSLIVGPADVPGIPLLDTTGLHVEAVVRAALA